MTSSAFSVTTSSHSTVSQASPSLSLKTWLSRASISAYSSRSVTNTVTLLSDSYSWSDAPPSTDSTSRPLTSQHDTVFVSNSTYSSSDSSTSHISSWSTNSTNSTNLLLPSKIVNSTISKHSAFQASNSSSHNTNGRCTAGHGATGLEESFPYKIPYGTVQSCDIYGPTCQPGSITVEATGKECGKSKVTMPCSSYLASQSSYLKHNEGMNYWFPQDWSKRFGRSHQCHALMYSYEELNGTAPWTFKQCSATGIVTAPPSLETMPPELPPGISRWSSVFEYCCGECIFNIPRVTVLYFRDEELHELCQSRRKSLKGLKGTTPVTSHLVYSQGQKVPRMADELVSVIPDRPGASTVIWKGHTL